jgi:hypothetical protein
MDLDSHWRKASRSRMASVSSSCHWSHWATLTLWGVTDSRLPIYTLFLFPLSCSVAVTRKLLSKASRSLMSSMPAIFVQSHWATPTLFSLPFLLLSSFNPQKHPE